MAASSSMINMRAAGSGLEALALPFATRMPASDMSSFPCHRKFEMESGAAFHLDLARMLLDNPITHREAQSCAPALSLAHRRFGGKEGVVNTLHVFEGD